MDPINQSGPINPNDKAIYRQDFSESLTLFQKSLSEFNQSNLPAQQDAFKDVMRDAMHIMNQTAQLCLDKHAQSEEAKLNSQFQAFLEDSSPENAKELKSRIQSLEDSV